MKSFTTWAPPVAVSLLYHTALIVLVTQHLAVTNMGIIPLQTITVELSGNMPTIENKPRFQKLNPIAISKSIPEPVKAEQATLVNSVSEESKTATAPNEQTSNVSTETKQVSLTIQPLSKLTRPPAFLRKIEPLYPGAEQRAGSQAYVLAEVTIDDKGNVLEVKIAKSAGVHFDNAVIDALRKSIFVPGYIDKEAVAVRVLVPFRFNLK